MKKVFYLAIFSMFLMTSCATLFTGTKDRISFNSKPQGAKVYIDGVEVCITPCTSPIQRSLSNKLAEIKLDGYKTKVISLDRKFNVVSVLNFFGLIGWGIDAATGAVMKYDRKGYDVELEKNNISLNNSKKINIDTKSKTVEVYVMK